MIPSGTVFFILIVAVLATAALAWMVARFYRNRLLALMRGGAPPRSAATGSDGDTSGQLGWRPPEPWASGIDLAANRRANAGLLLRLGVISLLIALTQAGLALFFVYDNRELSLNRLLVLTAIYAWPMMLAWGLARRWSWLRILGAIALYMLAMLVIVLVRSTETQSLLSVSGWLFSQVAIPMTITLLIGASSRVRAVAPYLLLPAIVLTGASVLALQVVPDNPQELPAWLVSLAGALGAYASLALLALAPWLILAWPVALMGKGLARAYQDKRFSDLTYLIGIYWFLILFTSALPAMESTGGPAFVQLFAWLWLPALPVWRPRPTPLSAPPTLLVLRVFQHDAQVERLFDQVIERWRLTGNTVLIAGTDVISHTLDPDDLFVLLYGALDKRFIADPAQIAGRIASFDWRPDPDGRYRLNECYCFESTWRPTLCALVRRAHVVLMDLRGFRAENRGCLYELSVLAGAGHLRRTVVLYDRDTALDVAQAETRAAAPGHFQWLPAERLDSAMADRVLAAMFGKAS